MSMRAIHNFAPASRQRLFNPAQASRGCPSIGGAGLMVDRISNRVKGIIPELLTRTNQLIDVLDNAHKLAQENGATRTTARVFLPSFSTLNKSRQGRALAAFLREFGTGSRGETINRFEGVIPFSSNSQEFMAVYLGMNAPSRMSRDSIIDLETEEARRASSNLEVRPMNSDYSIRIATQRDVSQLVELYGSIFTSYLVELNSNNISEMVASTPTLVSVYNGEVVAALAAEHASLEVEGVGTTQLIEISEAATHPMHRGNRLYSHMIGMFLSTLERDIGQDASVVYAETRASHPAAARGAILAGGQVSGFLNKHCVINAVRDVEETGEYENLNVVSF